MGDSCFVRTTRKGIILRPRRRATDNGTFASRKNGNSEKMMRAKRRIHLNGLLVLIFLRINLSELDPVLRIEWVFLNELGKLLNFILHIILPFRKHIPKSKIEK